MSQLLLHLRCRAERIKLRQIARVKSLNFFLGKLNPLGYHVFNLFFHILNGILFYILMRSLARGAPRALCTLIAMIFLAHPLNTEAVSYVSSRSDLLAVFFMLSGILFLLRHNRCGLFICYALTLLTKETGLIFIPLLAGCRRHSRKQKPPAYYNKIFSVHHRYLPLLPPPLFRRHAGRAYAAVFSEYPFGSAGNFFLS